MSLIKCSKSCPTNAATQIFAGRLFSARAVVGSTVNRRNRTGPACVRVEGPRGKGLEIEEWCHQVTSLSITNAKRAHSPSRSTVPGTKRILSCNGYPSFQLYIRIMPRKKPGGAASAFTFKIRRGCHFFNLTRFFKWMLSVKNFYFLHSTFLQSCSSISTSILPLFLLISYIVILCQIVLPINTRLWYLQRFLAFSFRHFQLYKFYLCITVTCELTTSDSKLEYFS